MFAWEYRSLREAHKFGLLQWPGGIKEEIKLILLQMVRADVIVIKEENAIALALIVDLLSCPKHLLEDTMLTNPAGCVEA